MLSLPDPLVHARGRSRDLTTGDYGVHRTDQLGVVEERVVVVRTSDFDERYT